MNRILGLETSKSNGIELVEMKGDVRFDDVDFGYFDDHMVLHNIRCFC